jgi:prepilin-type N-terminal cleavage/methylation domain-containing protein
MWESSVSANKQAGFTLVELLVALTVMSVIGLVFLGLIANNFVLITRNSELSEMTVNSQNLLRTTVENIRLGDGVRQTNQISDAHAPSGGWNTSNSNFVIILAVPAIDSSHNYIIDSGTGAPYMNELVYYKNGTDLMERKLANPGATGNRLITSCPANFASASCPADTQLAQYVNTMVFALYDQDGASTSTAAAARSVNISLNMQRNAPGDPINLTTNIRVTLRNRF